MQIVKFKPQDHFIKALIFWKPGSGKTTFASTAPKPIFLSAEAGLLSIADKAPDAIIVKTLKDLQDAHDYLKTQKHDYQTVIIDSITEINEIIKAEIERKNNRAIRRDDWGEVSTKIKRVIRDFRDLPMHCIFLAQESIERDEDTVVRIYPSLNGKSATEIAAACDVVGYLDIDKTLGERYMVVKEHAVLATKNRLEPLKVDSPSLDFSEWVKLMWSICVGEQCVVANHEAPPEEDKYAPPGFKAVVPKGIGDKRIDPETVKLIDEVWWRFMNISLTTHPEQKDQEGLVLYRPENSDNLKKATIKKLYIVNDQSGLTEKQALDFMQRIEDKISLMIPKEIPDTVQPTTTAVDPGHPDWDQAWEITVEKEGDKVKVTEKVTKAKGKKKPEPVEDAVDTTKNIFQKEDTVEIK